MMRELGCVVKRFIPAYAGNTEYSFRNPASRSVHPRVCGEHARYLEFIPAFDGSSPRMRGTLVNEADDRAEFRFIPAYAGNTEA